MKSLYLSGPITGLTYDDATGWRDWVKQHLAHDVIPLDPMRGKEYLVEADALGLHYPEHAMSTARAIFHRDRHDTLTCTAMLVNVLGTNQRKCASVGTVVEIGWASSRPDCPIILVAEPDNYLRNHALTQEACAYFVDTLSEGVGIANALLSESFMRHGRAREEG